MLAENKLLEICVKMIEERSEMGNSKSWSHKYFNTLREKIYNETNELISISSLKRIFGKIDSKHAPRTSTKNALVQYIGFKDWDNFEQAQKQKFNELPSPSKEENISKSSEKKVKKKQKTRYFLFLFVLIAFIAIVLIKSGLNKQQHFLFHGKYLQGKSPHTVLFHYDVSEIEDSVFVFFDDSFSEDKISYLDPGMNTITHCYTLPDVYRIKVYTEKSILVDTNAVLYTNTWKAYWCNMEKMIFKPIPFYQEQGKSFTNLYAFFDTSATYNKREDPYSIKLRKIEDIGISGNEFTFTSQVRCESIDEGIHCPTVGFSLLGDSLKIKTDFTTIGCYYYAYVGIGNDILDGEHADLSFMTNDFMHPTELKITNNQEEGVQIYINNVKVYTHPQKMEIGDLKGLLINFTGKWYINTIKITDGKGQNVLNDVF